MRLVVLQQPTRAHIPATPAPLLCQRTSGPHKIVQWLAVLPSGRRQMLWAVTHQSLTLQSVDADAMEKPSGLNATALTAPVCPKSVWTGFLRGMCQMRTVLSSPGTTGNM